MKLWSQVVVKGHGEKMLTVAFVAIAWYKLKKSYCLVEIVKWFLNQIVLDITIIVFDFEIWKETRILTFYIYYVYLIL